jgi:hypothetical protein
LEIGLWCWTGNAADTLWEFCQCILIVLTSRELWLSHHHSHDEAASCHQRILGLQSMSTRGRNWVSHSQDCRAQSRRIASVWRALNWASLLDTV